MYAPWCDQFFLHVIQMCFNVCPRRITRVILICSLSSRWIIIADIRNYWGSLYRARERNKRQERYGILCRDVNILPERQSSDSLNLKTAREIIDASILCGRISWPREIFERGRVAGIIAARRRSCRERKGRIYEKRWENDDVSPASPALHPRYIACDASCVAIATLECGPRRAEDNQRAFEKPVVEKTNARYHPRSRVLSALRARKAATRKYRFRLPQIPAIQGSLSRTRSSRPLPRGRARIPLKAAP